MSSDSEIENIVCQECNFSYNIEDGLPAIIQGQSKIIVRTAQEL